MFEIKVLVTCPKNIFSYVDQLYHICNPRTVYNSKYVFIFPDVFTRDSHGINQEEVEQAELEQAIAMSLALEKNRMECEAQQAAVERAGSKTKQCNGRPVGNDGVEVREIVVGVVGTHDRSCMP